MKKEINGTNTYSTGHHDGKPDPTHNVQGLVVQTILRLDDLREAERHRVNEAMEAERRRVTEQMVLRAEYNIQLASAEAKRIDAIRAVDVNAVSVANEKATAQAVVLANQVAASAETLRALVAATAATTAQQLSQLTNQLTDRLSSLEKTQYEGAGKQAVSDPMMAELIAEMKGVRLLQSEGAGTRGGQKDVMGYVIAAAALLIAAAGVIIAVVLKP